MKKVFFLGMALCLLAGLSFAQQGNAPITIKGVIIDNQCAGSQTPEQLAKFVLTHTKECALMPACVASGYSIFSNGKLRKFDKESNGKVESFLKKPESKLQVEIVAKENAGLLSVVSIANQK